MRKPYWFQKKMKFSTAKFVSVLVTLLKVVGCTYNVSIVEKVSAEIGTRLKNLVDASLEISALENIYEEKTRLVKQEYDPFLVLHNIVGNISDRLDNAVDILKRNRDFIQQNYVNVTRNTNINSAQCCISKNLRFSARFNLVEGYKTCFTNALVSSLDLDTFYQKNLDNSLLLLWQYFGDSDGNYHQYPWKPRQSVCSSTKPKDHRFQDWYVFTASPKKKNVVIVVDESGSMSIPNGGFKHPNTTLRVDIAKDAARTVLETFSPTDHVGVVAFSNEPRSPSGCLCSQIARATVENKKIIHQFIDSIKPKKDTYYGKAFKSAFRLLREAKQQTPEQFENSLDMILFLTDGTPSESNINSILEEIVQGQDSLNNTIKIFVYGFGQEILNSKSQSKTDLLLMIADQNNQNMSSMFGIAGGKQLQWPQLSNLPDTSKPIGPVGNLTILPDVDTEQLRNVMGTYYTKFPMSQHTDYSISLPHIEDKLGLVTTLGIPTLDKGGNFFGVTGIDLSLLLMFYEVEHFRQGQHGYGFVVGNSGKILVHPYMPNPQQQMEQPRFYEIDQIEPVLSDESVFNITNGLPGHFYSKIAALWKTPDVQGTKPATFYYKPIIHFHGNYSVVLVIFDEDMEELRADEDIEKGEFPSFIYHRMDLYDNDTLSIAGFCTRDNSVVLKNNATVKFAPSVYSNPVKSLEYEQNNKNRSYPFYQHYRNARLFSKNADIHQSASNDIVLTDITDQVWTQDDMIWRYLGTENGFFKIFPGTMLSDIHYDPRDDIWYRKAAENPEKYIFIDMETPKQNSSTYVTVAKVFYQTSNGSVSGVVAADMSRRQFSTILTNMMTSCLHCYILDDAGYVFGQANSSMDLTRAHITQIAGPVSFLLLKQGFLKPEVCMDATSGVKRLTYRLDLGGGWSSIRKVGCHDYTLMAINNTNLYLLSYKPDNCFSLDVGTCYCQEKCLLCNNQMDSMCQCPCTCVNRAIDICNSSFTMTRGYAPCRESLRHWKTVKTINLHQSNVTECEPQCPSFQTEKGCLLMSGCTWCSTGFYSNIPICTQTCPKDRMEIYMKAPCHNLTEHSHQYLPLEVQKLLQSIVNDSNFGISLPMIIKQDMINFTISTRDRTSISNNWTKMLSKPFYTKDDIVFVNQHTMNEFTLLKLTLAFNNVNFTKEFETELTLREYIDVRVKDFISQALNNGSVTVSNVWPEQNEISCMLNTSTTNKTVLVQQTQTWNISTLPRIDVFGRKLSLVNISVEHSYNTLCHVNCHQIDDQYECNLVPGCHWDFYSQGICTNNSLIPERVKATVTLPCLGLYSNKTFSEHDVIKQFEDLLVNEIPSLEKTMLKLRIIEDSTLIGRQIQIVLQGRVTSPSVSEIWWDIQQLMEDRQNVSVNGTRYQIVGHPVAYQQFTNMYIALTLDGFNADSLIQDHPLDGREEITHAVIEVAKSYLRHQIVKSIRDIKFSMDEVTFSVDSSYDNSIDLRSEYDILQKAVTNGQVNVTIFDQTYDVKYVFFIGSFDYICPRSCDEGTQSTCSIIPGCDWSNTGKCLSDVVFPERKIINVVFPCIDIRKLTDPERNQLLSKTTQHITKYLKTKTLSTVVTSVHYQKDNPNHIFIDLQATSRSPPLSDLYKDTEQWLKDKKLEISLNNYTLLGRSTNDFTSISVALEFSNINFTELSIYKRMDWMKELSRRLKLILSDGVSIDNEWFTLNYSIFDIKSSNNLSHHIDLDKDLEKIQTFINLGGLTFHSQSNPVTPHNVLMNGNIDCSICNLTTQICKMERKCFWQGKWDVKFCKAVNNPDKFTYEVLLPCNQTQTLTLDEKKESEIVLYNKILQLLHPAGQHIINSVHIQQERVMIELQTSPLYPYLERYAEMLQQQVDFRTGFNFGPSNKTTDLVPRHMEDFTNAEITLNFRSIDFDAIVNSGLASYSQISSLFNRKINAFMLGEIVQSYKVRTIEKDFIRFSLKKRYDSYIVLSREITQLKHLVDAGVFDLDINYIRPVTATRMSVLGTFDELCDNLAGQITGPVINTLPTVASNVSIHQIPIAMIPVPTILVLYNRSTANIPNLQTVIDTMYVDVCFIEMKKSPLAMESFSWNTCSFKTPVKENTMKTERSDPDHIGPVQWTIIGVGGIFILALALWAIQGIHEMSKKNKSKESAPQNCSIEDTE